MLLSCGQNGGGFDFFVRNHPNGESNTGRSSDGIQLRDTNYVIGSLPVEYIYIYQVFYSELELEKNGCGFSLIVSRDSRS